VDALRVAIQPSSLPTPHRACVDTDTDQRPALEHSRDDAQPVALHELFACQPCRDPRGSALGVALDEEGGHAPSEAALTRLKEGRNRSLCTPTGCPARRKRTRTQDTETSSATPRPTKRSPNR
jgi:hypothetical protein